MVKQEGEFYVLGDLRFKKDDPRSSEIIERYIEHSEKANELRLAKFYELLHTVNDIRQEHRLLVSKKLGQGWKILLSETLTFGFYVKMTRDGKVLTITHSFNPDDGSKITEEVIASDKEARIATILRS